MDKLRPLGGEKISVWGREPAFSWTPGRHINHRATASPPADVMCCPLSQAFTCSPQTSHKPPPHSPHKLIVPHTNCTVTSQDHRRLQQLYTSLKLITGHLTHQKHNFPIHLINSSVPTPPPHASQNLLLPSSLTHTF